MNKYNYEIIVKKDNKILELIDGFYTLEELLNLEDELIDKIQKELYPNTDIYWVRERASITQPTFIFINKTIYTGIKIFKNIM